MLRATAALFNASEEVTRQEFAAFVGAYELRINYPAIQSLGFVPQITDAGKAAYLRQMRHSGVPAYEIHPVGTREIYAPIAYLEPAPASGDKQLGVDLYADSVRRKAMESARDQMKMVVTAVEVAAQGTNGNGKHWMELYAPLYLNDLPHDTLDERRTNFAGWVQLSLFLDDIIHAAMGEMESDVRDTFAMSAYFRDDGIQGAMVYQSPAKIANDDRSRKSSFRTERIISLAGRQIVLSLHSRPEFEARINDAKSISILVAGVIVSALLALLVWVLVNGRTRAIQIAKRINRDMIMRERRYRQMFEDNASIAYILNPDTGEIMDANASAAAFWGYSRNALRTMNIASINLMPFSEIRNDLQHHMEDGNPALGNYRHRLKNGEIRDVEIYRTILSHQGSDFVYCIVHDITERRKVEKALRDSQEKLHVIIETAMDAVVQINGDGIITDWNSRAEKTFGWTREEAIGRPMVDSLIPPHQQSAYFLGVKQYVDAEEGAIRHSHFEIEAVDKEGRAFPLEVAITTIVGEDGSLEYCAFMHDITERKRTDNALRKARIELENRVFERTAELVRANRRLNTEIADRTQAQEAQQQSQEMLRQLVAHQDRIRESERKRIAREIHDELGQHLLVLRIDVSMLARSEVEHPKLGEKVDAILQHIDTTMRSVRAIINNLRPSVLDLGLFAALEWQAEEFQRRSGITCELSADDEEMDLEDNVSTVLFRILQEALTNVLRHAKASRVRIALQNKPGFLIMTISDNGVGIAQSRASEHNSFGLVGIRERLHMLGGELQLDSSGHGTVLTVTVPVRA